MRKKFKNVWSVEWMRGKKGDMFLGTFASKIKALEAIEFWAEDGEYLPLDIDNQKPFNNKCCIVNIKRFGKGQEMIFVHKVSLDNGAPMGRIKYEK